MNPSTTSTLLHLDASPRGARSHSRRLGQKFLAAWRAAHPAAHVVVRDIGREPPPFVTEAWIEGAFASTEQQTAAAREAMAVSNRYVDELLAADQLVITTPIYNLSLPAVLKAWIDQIVRAGRTFAKSASGFEGLAQGKRALVIVASGSDFRPASPGGACNFLEPYLRAVLGFIGIVDAQFVYAHSLAAGESASRQAVAEAQAWEAQHGLGAAWGPEENRADVLAFDAQKPGAARVFATGIRNCVGLVVQPANGELWCTTNERDLLGDDLVPDYSTRVREGGFYGWPWYYFGNHEDPRLKGERPDLAGKALVPDVPFQAHSAALNLAFYEATSGAAAFPAEWRGEGFVALHGSWNRGLRTGHKVVRVLMKDGVPTGEYEDFLTGFITGEGEAWGRPVCPVVARDGALLVSDDAGNTIWRVAPAR